MVGKIAENKYALSQNAGFSLVELVVVLAIMAILTAVGLNWFGLIPGTQVKGCAEDLELALDQARTDALSYKTAYLELYVTSDGVFVDTYVDKGKGLICTTEQVGKAGVGILYRIGSGTDYETLAVSNGTTTDRLRIAYSRTSGGFEKCALYEGTSGGTSTVKTNYSSYCSTIRIYKGSSERELHLVELTGKIED